MFDLYCGDALDAYRRWPSPDVIVSDGAYGLGGFPGDPASIDGLVDWYRPHVERWAQRAHPGTTLWLWNTEQGWATLHSLLLDHGWGYEQAIVWDKGMGHVAGNSNGSTLRRFPVVTEMCVLYSREVTLPTEEGALPLKQWLRREWMRSGIPLARANEACGVRSAATRKYLTADDAWYFPPGEMVVRLADYATRNGRPTDRPYFSLDGVSAVTSDHWNGLRYEWNFAHGLTNVWSHPPLNGSERYRVAHGRSVHLNQKPVSLMRRILRACTSPGAVVWEPFGGLCSASVGAIEMGRRPFAAEANDAYAALATRRLNEAAAAHRGDAGVGALVAGAS